MDMEVIKNPSTAVSSPPVVVAGGDETKTLKTSSFKRLMKSDSMRKTMERVHSYIEEVGRVTKFNPQDDWLPITESRNGNAFYSAFHTLSSGIGFQALLLPLAFVALGWSWGIICLSLIFMWQLYTIWLLVELHESQPGTGTRFSRYLRLSIAAFGVKRGKLLTIFPIMYLSGGSCVTLIMIGGGTLKIFFQIVLGDTDTNTSPLTTVEWYLLFVCFATLLAQLPNLNSIAGVSLVGAITAVIYCTLIWVLSVVEGRAASVSYDLPEAKSEFARVCSIFDALGIIAFAFRGHNLILEIQGTMPSSEAHPSKVPMWRGVEFAYLIIGMCYFPLAIASYWAYGNSIPTNGGMLRALEKYHGLKASETILGITCLLVVINSLSSFQIYAMPVFDNLEFRYVSSKNKPCPTWLRCCIRAFFGGLTFFISVALPFLPSLAGLIGGVALPLTLAYPCFMWIVLKKPGKYSSTWCLNWVLGVLGISLSILVIGGAIYSIITKGIEANFFKPK